MGILYVPARLEADHRTDAVAKVRSSVIFHHKRWEANYGAGRLRDGHRQSLEPSASDAAGSPFVFAGGAVWERLCFLSLRSVLGLLGRPDNLIDPSHLRRLLERHPPFPNLEDAMIPLHVIATNLGGTAVCLSSGPAIDAVMASAAIPGAVRPEARPAPCFAD